MSILDHQPRYAKLRKWREQREQERLVRVATYLRKHRLQSKLPRLSMGTTNTTTSASTGINMCCNEEWSSFRAVRDEYGVRVEVVGMPEDYIHFSHQEFLSLMQWGMQEYGMFSGGVDHA